MAFQTFMNDPLSMVSSLSSFKLSTISESEKYSQSNQNKTRKPNQTIATRKKTQYKTKTKTAEFN